MLQDWSWVAHNERVYVVGGLDSVGAWRNPMRDRVNDGFLDGDQRLANRFSACACWCCRRHSGRIPQATGQNGAS